MANTNPAGRRLRKAAPPEVKPVRSTAEAAEQIVTFIGEGKLDKHLRQIVRACFYRREVLTGEAHVIPDPPADPPVSRSPLPKLKTTVPRPPLQDVGMMYQWFAGGNAEEIALHSIKPSTTTMAPVSFRGRDYRRGDFLSKYVVVPPGVERALRGVRVGIIGMGKENVKVVILDPPADNVDHVLDKYRNVEPHFIPHRLLLPHLVTEHDD